MKPRALDLFCGAGGATKGLQMAGFIVHGIDIRPQRRYCGEQFTQADALSFPTYEWIRKFDFIWASPPCQAHTAMRTMPDAKPHPDLVPATRDLLRRSNLPYVIENVPGAPLIDPILLCGTMFGLGTEKAELRRHRLFECSFSMLHPECRHGQETIGVYGGHVRNRKRATIGIYGEGCRNPRRRGRNRGVEDFCVEDGRQAMGIDWMTIAELSQAIPPAYSEFIGRQVLSILEPQAAG